MSELKAINAYQLTTNTEDSDVFIHNDEFGCGGDLVECYLKSEADEVIAELKSKTEAAERQVENLTNSATDIMLRQDKAIDTKCDELRHQKRKRCLAMAKWCDAQVEWYNSLNEDYSFWLELYAKWHNRWLELAEKFKEAK